MVIRTRTTKAAAKAKAEAERQAEIADKTPPAPAAAKRPLLQRFFDSTATLEPEEIVDCAHWIRQTQAVVVGVIYGALKVTGSVGITSFLMMALLGPPNMIRRIHNFDEEEVAKVGSVASEGLLPAFALFLLCWIISYTTFL